MPIFGRHYQRGSLIPKEAIVGYNYSFMPSEFMITRDLETKFDIYGTMSYNPDCFVLLDTAGLESTWLIVRNQFEIPGVLVPRRYFQILNASNEPLTDPVTGHDTFYVSGLSLGTEEWNYLKVYFKDEDGGELTSSFPHGQAAKIRMRYPHAWLREFDKLNSLSVPWQSLFMDSGIPRELNDGYGWEYILLPEKGHLSFPEYFYWGPMSNPTVRIPIYPIDDIPLDLPNNTITLVRSVVTYQLNRYWFIRKRGYGNQIAPTSLHNIMLHTTGDDGSQSGETPPASTPSEEI